MTKSAKVTRMTKLMQLVNFLLTIFSFKFLFSFYTPGSPGGGSGCLCDECPDEVCNNLLTSMVDPDAKLCDDVELAIAIADVTTLVIP